VGTLARRAGTTIATLALAAVLLAPGASARGPSFTHPVKLLNSPPKGELQGGEPSVAFDPDGRWTYIVAPGGGENGGRLLALARQGAKLPTRQEPGLARRRR